MALPEKVTYIVQGQFTKKPSKKGSRRVLRWRGSTPTIDRDGDSIPLEGWDTDNFLKNPVVLFGHDYHSLPVGRARSITMSEDGMDFDIEFPSSAEEAGEHFKFTDSVYRMASNGFLSAASVGFRPLESPEYPEESDGVTRASRIWGKRELLELSIVPVPSNPTALRRGLDSGKLDKDQDLPFLLKVMQDEGVAARNKEWTTAVKDIMDQYTRDDEEEEIDNQVVLNAIDELKHFIMDFKDTLVGVGDKIDRAVSSIVLATPDHGTPLELSQDVDTEKAMVDLDDWLNDKLVTIKNAATIPTP
jgi:HK97 family phage prohead protease